MVERAHGSMHLVGRMAFEAGHAALDPVDVGLHAFVLALILVLDAASVAARARDIHGRDLFEHVTFDESTP
jgi:hypothetical protein